MYFTKEKNRYSECYKKVLYAGPKSARNILTNLNAKSQALATNTPKHHRIEGTGVYIEFTKQVKCRGVVLHVSLKNGNDIPKTNEITLLCS